VVAGLDLVGDLRDFWFTRGFFSEGIAQATTVLDLPGAAGATPARARALTTRAWLLHWHGNYADAIADGEEALTICASTGVRTVEPFVRNTLALAYESTPYVEAAKTLYMEALAVAREVGDVQTLARVLANLGSWAAIDGDAVRAASLFDESITISRASGDDDTLALALWAKSMVLWTTLGLQEASRLVRESLALYRGLGGPWGIVQCLDQLATLALANGATEQATRLYASAAALGQRHGIAPNPDHEAPRQRNLEQLRTQLGDEHFKALWAAQLRVPLEQVLDEALADAADEPSQRGPSPADRPAGLTPRELDVLRLLTQGLSDREIGDRLYISHYTVMRHVTGILGKLEVSSRTAAAAWAVRHDLG
jgi:DNA-binding CsgD family transcriptional regulator/tetratricopeptide (TPR) repeat protein